MIKFQLRICLLLQDSCDKTNLLSKLVKDYHGALSCGVFSHRFTNRAENVVLDIYSANLQDSIW